MSLAIEAILERSGRVENGVSVIPERYEPKTLRWQGVGSHIRMTTPRSETSNTVFLLQRVDNPLFRKSDVKPIVVRVIDEARPDVAEDYVSYDDEPEHQSRYVADIYRVPKVIEDVDGYLRGEWPIPQEYLERSASDILRAFEEIAGAEPDTTISLERADGKYSFQNIGPAGLQEAGTLPFYPIR